jgi:hypothetical protein
MASNDPITAGIYDQRNGVQGAVCTAMSALGQKQIWRRPIAMSALPPKADIAKRRSDVRLVPKAEVEPTTQ